MRLELSRLFLPSFSEWRCLRCLSFWKSPHSFPLFFSFLFLPPLQTEPFLRTLVTLYPLHCLFVCLFFCFFVGINPENPYFTSRPGLEDHRPESPYVTFKVNAQVDRLDRIPALTQAPYRCIPESSIWDYYWDSEFPLV